MQTQYWHWPRIRTFAATALIGLTAISSCRAPDTPAPDEEETPTLTIRQIVQRTMATSPAGDRDDGAASIIDADGWSYCRGPSLKVTNFGQEGEVWREPIGVRPNKWAPSHPPDFNICFGETRDPELEDFQPIGPSFRFMPLLKTPPEGYPPTVLARFPREDLPRGTTMDDVYLAILSHPVCTRGPRDPYWSPLGQIRFLGPPGTGEFALGYWSKATWVQPVVKMPASD